MKPNDLSSPHADLKDVREHIVPRYFEKTREKSLESSENIKKVFLEVAVISNNASSRRYFEQSVCNSLRPFTLVQSRTSV